NATGPPERVDEHHPHFPTRRADRPDFQCRGPPGDELHVTGAITARESASMTEATVARAVRTQCTKEVHPAESRPVGLAEIEFRVHALPQHDTGQSLLARGADEQLVVSRPARDVMPRDVFDVHPLSQLLELGSLVLSFVEERPHPVSALTTTPTPGGDVDNQSRIAGSGLLRR